MGKDSEEWQISRREWAKKMRREAYERAKERRASDPKYLAMKEEAKKRRREGSQVAKERRKAADEKRKLAGKEREATEPVANRATAVERLRGMMRTASDLEWAAGEKRLEPQNDQDRGPGSAPRS